MTVTKPLAHDQVLVIDRRNPRHGLDRGKLLSTQALYEYSTVIWEVDSLLNEMASYHPRTASVALEQGLIGRLKDFEKWVRDGHSLIVVGPPGTPLVRSFPDGTSAVAPLHKLFPLNLLTVTITQGAKLVPSRTPAGAVLAPFLASMSYRATLAGSDFIPTVFAQRATPGEPFAVGGMVHRDKGSVFFVPAFNEPDDVKAEAFYHAISKLPSTSKSKPDELPEWTKSFRTTREEAIAVRIDDLNDKRQELDRKMALEKAALAEDEDLKQLLAGTGSSFLNAVITGLRELGLAVVEGPNSRADLIATCADRYVAVEAKGVEGSVKERQYRQVERWRAELNTALNSSAEEIIGDPEISQYAECVAQVRLSDYDGRDAKGLLVVGTYRHARVDQRSETDFPDTVRRLLERSDVCGMTGVQLFGLVNSVRETPDLRVVIQKELLETRGVLERCKSWNDFLVKV